MIDSKPSERQATSGDGDSVSGLVTRSQAIDQLHAVAASPRIRLSTLLPLVLPIVLAVIAAYVQWFTVGLPHVPALRLLTRESTTLPYGFPAWIGITHYVNLLFMVLLARSGLQILMDHPRLYWNVHCTPGTEWVRFTPVQVPLGRLYTAKDDARYLSPWIGLPGGRHTL
jgi:methionine sulfoxide reductase catalytic subunit